LQGKFSEKDHTTELGTGEMTQARFAIKFVIASASEAIHNLYPGKMDCFVALLLAMTAI